VVGEVRGGEALDMLQAMNTGHDGSLTTVHANSPADALSRLETMVMWAETELDSSAIRDQIVGAINIIAQQDRMSDGSRKITSIAEVQGIKKGEIVTRDIFSFVQYGVDEEIINYTPPPPTDDRPFIFLSVATSLFDRKGAMTAMQAFRQLDAPNARLVLKFNSGYEVTVKDEPNIKCLVGDFSGWEFINLLQRSHCVVYPSSGEGFGLVPLEAMAVGRPVILTNYSGMTEYIDERYCYPLEIEGVQRAELYNRIYNADGSWAMISVDKLQDSMQHIYDNYEEATKRGRLASEYALSDWTWKQAGKRAYRILEEFRYT